MGFLGKPTGNYHDRHGESHGCSGEGVDSIEMLAVPVSYRAGSLQDSGVEDLQIFDEAVIKADREGSGKTDEQDSRRLQGLLRGFPLNQTSNAGRRAGVMEVSKKCPIQKRRSEYCTVSRIPWEPGELPILPGTRSRG